LAIFSSNAFFLSFLPSLTWGSNTCILSLSHR
jgi:hypothetical protein